MSFVGAKIALFIGGRLLVYRRDDKPTIPLPGHWDFPGGGREGDETPQNCVLRETEEEFGLRLLAVDLIWKATYPAVHQPGVSWFFAAHLPETARAEIRFGDEGQEWRLIAPATYATMPWAIPYLAERLEDYLSARGC